MTDLDTTRPADRRPPLRGRPRRTAVVFLIAASTLLVGSMTAAAATGGFTHSWWDQTTGTTGTMRGGTMMGGTTAGGPGMMNGTGMMGGAISATMGPVWLAGNGKAVTSIADARQRAAQAATSAGLHPGEVMWFDNGFYVELKDAAGHSATEVIVNLGNGAVTTEPGPAMMWNTRHGMMAAGTGMMGGANGMMGHRGPGMMGGAYGGGDGPADSGQAATVTAEQARSIAQKWLDANRSGERAQESDSYPGYFTMDTTVAGKTLSMLSVNAVTGAVWYHTWHGRFVASEDA